MVCHSERSVSGLPLLGILSRVSRDWWLNCNVRVYTTAYGRHRQRPVPSFISPERVVTPRQSPALV